MDRTPTHRTKRPPGRCARAWARLRRAHSAELDGLIGVEALAPAYNAEAQPLDSDPVVYSRMNGMPSRYKTRAFARLAGVTVKPLYHYERRGLLRPARTASRYRTYTATDLRRIREIQALRFLGFTLGQI